MTSMMIRTARAAGLLGFALAGFAAPSVLAQTQPAPKASPSRPATPAPAAPAAPAGIKVGLKAAPDQPDWIKVSDKDPGTGKTVSFTTRDFVAENNQPVMAVAIFDLKEDKRRFARFLVPLTFMIQPGIRFSAEGIQPLNARFQICVQQGCFVEGELNDAAIAALRKASTLRIDMQNQVGQEVNFEVPLAGFAKAFDGEGMTPEDLQKKAQEQGSAPPAPGAAQPANADPLRNRGQEMINQRQQQAPRP